MTPKSEMFEMVQISTTVFWYLHMCRRIVEVIWASFTHVETLVAFPRSKSSIETFQSSKASSGHLYSGST